MQPSAKIQFGENSSSADDEWWTNPGKHVILYIDILYAYPLGRDCRKWANWLCTNRNSIERTDVGHTSLNPPLLKYGLYAIGNRF